MSYLVLARKYRPQSFDEVIGQAHVCLTLQNAITMQRMAHAILFAGPRGTGKTTVARILAKAMNCDKGPTPTPCNECPSCVGITGGHSADVFEIDGASNNSVDQVRELRENIKYLPASSPYKIYIIDEVHMLSIAAFNALLKTLEEPPPHVMFFFATTEPHKIPITILSRCQRHDLRRIDMEAIISHMGRLCQKEGIDIPAESLQLIAREGGGSMRDALSLLDQILAAVTDDRITTDQVLDLLGVVDRKILFDLSRAILSGEMVTILEALDDIYNRGFNLKRLYGDLLEHFRNLLIIKISKGSDRLIDLPAYEKRLLADQAADVSTAHLNQIFDIWFQAAAEIKYTELPRIALEMLFFRIYQIRPALSIDELIQRLDGLQSRPQDVTAAPAISQPPAAKSADPPAENPVAPRDDPDLIWRKILARIAVEAPALHAQLHDSTLAQLSAQTAQIQVNGNPLAVQLASRPKNTPLLKALFKAETGRDLAITVVAGEIMAENTAAPPKDPQLEQAAFHHPIVQDAVKIFKAHIEKINIL